MTAIEIVRFDWVDQAACRGMDPAMFIPAEKNPPAPQAVAACAACPVREECAEYAITNERLGYWGGLGQSERMLERRRRGITITGGQREIPHGTRAGYQRHRSAGTVPCAACSAANSRYVKESRSVA